MNNYYDVIIIGGGAAGMSAAIYACRSGASVAVIEQFVAGGLMAATPYIENYPGFNGISGYELAEKMQNQAMGCGAEFIYAEAQSITNGKFKTVLAGGTEYACRALILALGSVPRAYGIKDEKSYLGYGLSYCATCDGNLFKGKTVAVAGEGNHARSAAEYLLKTAKKVYVFTRGKGPEINGTECIGGAEIVSVLGKPIQYISVKKGGEIINYNVDGLFISLGYTPATGIASGLVQTDLSGYIICNEYMQTSIEGIFAAGDIRVKPLRQISTAVSDGAIAGQFAALYCRKGK